MHKKRSILTLVTVLAISSFMGCTPSEKMVGRFYKMVMALDENSASQIMAKGPKILKQMSNSLKEGFTNPDGTVKVESLVLLKHELRKLGTDVRVNEVPFKNQYIMCDLVFGLDCDNRDRIMSLHFVQVFKKDLSKPVFVISTACSLEKTDDCVIWKVR